MFLIPLLGYNLDDSKAKRNFRFCNCLRGKVTLIGVGTFSVVKRVARKGGLFMDRNGVYPRLLNGRKI